MTFPGRLLLLAVHRIDDKPVPLFGKVYQCDYEADGLYRVELDLLPVPEHRAIKDWLLARAHQGRATRTATAEFDHQIARSLGLPEACTRLSLGGVKVVHSSAGVRSIVGAPGACVLIPTMGALHEGHVALVRRGVELAAQRKLAGGCVVWVFVNPTQFNDKKDLERYPRTLGADAAMCQDAGASVVYAPPVEEVYPPDAPVAVPPLPKVATEPGLEDRFRPGHFAGVCQVVRRMFALVEPAAAVFGEKDWQQLQVVTAMTKEAGLPIEIVPHATIREEGGLAMSSRNRFLSAEDRERGLAISRALRAAGGGETAAEGERLMQAELASEGITEPDYAAIVDARTLRPADSGPWRALIAARVGSVRLLDNAPWSPAR